MHCFLIHKRSEKWDIFIVLKILLFPDLLFVHCVTFRETNKQKNTVVCFGRLRQSFWTSVHVFVTFVGFWEPVRLLGNSEADGGFELNLSCPNTSVDKDHGRSVTVEINVMYIFKGLSCVSVLGEDLLIWLLSIRSINRVCCGQNWVGDNYIGQEWFCSYFSCSEIPEFNSYSEASLRNLRWAL